MVRRRRERGVSGREGQERGKSERKGGTVKGGNKGGEREREAERASGPIETSERGGMACSGLLDGS